MTGSHHNSGTERCNEAYDLVREQDSQYDAIINIQGDEPYIRPEQIYQVISCFEDSEVMIASLMKRILPVDDLHDPNVVKVISDVHGNALYFQPDGNTIYKRQGYLRLAGAISLFSVISEFTDTGPGRWRISLIYPGHRLKQLNPWKQLRWLENSFRIRMKETSFESISVDTPADLLKLTNIR